MSMLFSIVQQIEKRRELEAFDDADGGVWVEDGDDGTTLSATGISMMCLVVPPPEKREELEPHKASVLKASDDA
jgi:hypothetical protein